MNDDLKITLWIVVIVLALAYITGEVL